MIYVFFWLIQDLLTVLTSGAMQIPEIFLLCLVYRLLTRDWEVNVSVIWTAFFGGLLWDLRWVGIPGFFALSYVSVVMLVLWVWNTLPASGRTHLVIFFLFWTAQLIPAILSTLLLGRNANQIKWMFFAAQQGCAVPVALLGTFFYFQHEKGQNA
jgi:rod shape-determining protein MreD